MPRMTKKLIKQIWDTTSHCYNKAVTRVHVNHKVEAPPGPPFDNRDINPDLKQEIDQVYRELLCKLSTKDIELIIEARKKGKIGRAQVTIDALMNELLERKLTSQE